MLSFFPSKDAFLTELQNIPDLETFKNNLKELFDKDKSNWSQKDISDFYTQKVGIIPNLHIEDMPPHIISIPKAFRVRYIDESMEDISIIKTFSYPNPVFCKENGRANLKNKSVFYCSLFEGETAMKEAKPEIGYVGFMSIWSINVDRNCKYTVFLPPNLTEVNGWHQAAKKHYKDILGSIKNIDIDKTKQIEQLYLFLTELYIKEEFPYSLTSWISDFMIYQKNYDFIVYPSFKLSSNTCNCAFHPKFVDKYFSFEKVRKFRVLDIKNGEPIIEHLGIGKINGNNIIWDYS